MSDLPLGDILRNSDSNGRIIKWAMELCGLNIDYPPRTAIKSQVLADFVAEWTEVQEPNNIAPSEQWTMYFDGSLRWEGVSAGVLFVSPSGEEL